MNIVLAIITLFAVSFPVSILDGRFTIGKLFNTAGTILMFIVGMTLMMITGVLISGSDAGFWLAIAGQYSLFAVVAVIIAIIKFLLWQKEHQRLFDAGLRYDDKIIHAKAMMHKWSTPGTRYSSLSTQADMDQIKADFRASLPGHIRNAVKEQHYFGMDYFSEEADRFGEGGDGTNNLMRFRAGKMSKKEAAQITGTRQAELEADWEKKTAERLAEIKEVWG